MRDIVTGDLIFRAPAAGVDVLFQDVNGDPIVIPITALSLAVVRTSTDGTAGAPAYSFDSQPGLGFYRSADSVVSLTGSLMVSGVVTLTADLVVKTIRRGTADGADSSYLYLSGGGSEAGGTSRGAGIILTGNEYPAIPGQALIDAGNVAGAKIVLKTENAERLRIDNGVIIIGNVPAVAIGALAGDVVLPNNRDLRGALAAGTNTQSLISLNTSNEVRVGPGATIVWVGADQAFMPWVGNGAQTVAIGNFGPAAIVTPGQPYAWLRMKLNDTSVVYLPVWK
jgi:hypothetical protein